MADPTLLSDSTFKISAEEHQEVVAKLVELSQSTAGSLPKEDQLYVEQQLIDLLGFEVTSALEGIEMKHTVGVMQAGQHLPRFPDDSLAQHVSFPEAGLSDRRSFFGWFTQSGQVTAQLQQTEQWYVGLPITSFPDWSENPTNSVQWWKYRKVIVINPVEEMAVVGSVAEAAPNQLLAYQYVGSPELIKAGQIWSLKSMGRVIMLFVDDPDNQVPLGPKSIAWTNKKL